MFRQLLLLLIAASAQATSVFPELHECPICGVKSVTMSLASYSQFGEPARDLSDSPQFRFANVEICPNDLFATWSGAWKTVKPGAKTKLAAFLKEPALHLAAPVKAAIAGHEKAFRESRWFEPLWAETCDGFRGVDRRRKFGNILQLHFAGQSFGEGKSPENWEQQLVSYFRENAIASLKEALTAKWPDPTEKRVFAYLHAELTRQAGRDEEALVLFKEVIASEKSAKGDAKLAWISRWAAEQSLRASPEAKDPEKLLAAIIPELPDPWRKKGADADSRWPRHFAAVDVLARKSAAGEAPFSNALWKLLNRKPERLLALLETTDANISLLREIDPRWRDWFDEIASLFQAGKLPPSLAADPNNERVANVLQGAVGSRDDGKAWRDETLLPAVRKAVTEGGIPSVRIPNDSSIPFLPPIAGESSKKPPAAPSFNKLARQLYELWQEQGPSIRPDIARVYIRILRQAEENHESTDYPVMYFLPEIAETEEGRDAIRNELGGTWKSSFWKAACAYAARLPESNQPFIRHPFTEKSDDAMIVKLLVQRSDPSWKDVAIKKLNEDDWVSSDVIEYLASLALPETEAALDAAAKRLRNPKSDPKKDGRRDGKLSTLQSIDRARVHTRLTNLPIR